MSGRRPRQQNRRRVKPRARLGPWRLTVRTVAHEPGQLIVIALLCAVAASAAILAHGTAVREEQRLSEYGRRRYGSVAIVAVQPGDNGSAADGSGSVLAPRFPLLTGETTLQPDFWLTEAIVDEIGSVAERLELGSSIRVRARGTAYGSDGVVRRLVAIDEGDPARALAMERPTARANTVAVLYTPDAPVSWVPVPHEAVIGVSASDVLWVELDWLHQVLRSDIQETVGASIMGNVVIVDAPSHNPFALAFELREVSEALADRLRFTAWPQLVGYERYVGSGGSAALLRPLVLVVAAIGVAGAVAVATRNRARDVVLLRTLGLTTAAVRGVYVRETMLASLAGSLLVALVIVVSTAVTVDTTVRRTLLITAFLPPFITFLTMRRQLRSPLARIRRESEL